MSTQGRGGGVGGGREKESTNIDRYIWTYGFKGKGKSIPCAMDEALFVGI